MPRPLKIDRPVRKHVSLPSSIVAQIELMLYSDVEGRVPQGAWQAYLTDLIVSDLRQRAERSAQKEADNAAQF